MGEVNKLFYIVVCFNPNGKTTVGWKGHAEDGRMYGDYVVSENIHEDIDKLINEGKKRLREISSEWAK